MSTNPTPQTPIMSDQLLNDFHTEFANLAHKHATVSFTLIGVLVLVLALAGMGGYLGLRSYDKALARADAKDAQYTAALKDFQTQLAQHDAERAATEAKVSQLEAQVARRSSQPLPAPVQAGLSPAADAKQAAEALKTVYNGLVVPEATPDGKVLTTVKETQLLTTSKLQLDIAQANFQDERAIVDLQNGSISNYQKDLTQCRGDLTLANKTIDGYKHVVKPGKFKRFLSSAKTVLLVAGAAYLGHKL